VNAAKQQQQLASQLRRLRTLASLSGRELGQQIGIDQSSISRIENAGQKITIAATLAWCQATGATDSQQATLLALAEDILIGPASWEEAFTTDSTDGQRTTMDLEARTGTLSIYQPAVLPGPVQTPAYARRVLSSGPHGTPADLASRVMNRIDRQAILYDETKHFRFVIPEAVLRWPFGTPGDPATLDDHHEQLARVATVSQRPNVELGILPLQPCPTWRLSGFVIYDNVEDGQPQVHLEWLTRPFDIFDPQQIQTCRQAFSNMLAESATGNHARDLITATAADLRNNKPGHHKTQRPAPST
jgi:transcriptional regulator with XRE-family HTH domain